MFKLDTDVTIKTSLDDMAMHLFSSLADSIGGLVSKPQAAILLEADCVYRDFLGDLFLPQFDAHTSLRWNEVWSSN